MHESLVSQAIILSEMQLSLAAESEQALEDTRYEVTPLVIGKPQPIVTIFSAQGSMAIYSPSSLEAFVCV